MLRRTSDHIDDCYRHAASCRDRAASANCANLHEFWKRREGDWNRLAAGLELSVRVATILKRASNRPARPVRIPPAAKEGVDALLGIFHRACHTLKLTADDQTPARAVARAILEAAMAGEDDPDKLYEAALKTISQC